MIRNIVKRYLRIVTCLSCSGALLFAVSSQAQVPEESRQLLVTVSSDWDATTGQLYAYQRGAKGWEQKFAAIPVNLGRTGFAWGIGLHPQQNGVRKREGDGKAPAGIFQLGDAFGYADTMNTGLGYQPMRASHYCIDVPSSPLYNQTVDAQDVGDKAVKGSSEGMRRDIHYGDQQYRKGIFIAHNPGNQPGAGSCIFMHLWQSAGVPTAGCTAMDEGAMDRLLAWLDRAQQPIYVALPQAEYERLRENWSLPSL